jgi:hypothetical protein
MRAQLVLAFMAVMVSCTSDSPTGMQEELVVRRLPVPFVSTIRRTSLSHPILGPSLTVL